MAIEKLITEMMTVNVKARLWHWMTDIAQHHTTFEQFLTQNEALTDSLVESAMGNEFGLEFNKIGVQEAMISNYSLQEAKGDIKSYRSNVIGLKSELGSTDKLGAEELTTILDDVIELCSKTMYLLNLK